MNGWRRVDRADIVPQACAVFPQLGASHRDGYIDTGTQMTGWDPHTYVSVEAARQLGEFVGLVPARNVEDLEAVVREREAHIQLLEEQLAELNRQLDAIDVLESAEFRARKKPGRPRKEGVPA